MDKYFAMIINIDAVRAINTTNSRDESLSYQLSEYIRDSHTLINNRINRPSYMVYSFRTSNTKAVLVLISLLLVAQNTGNGTFKVMLNFGGCIEGCLGYQGLRMGEL